MISHGEPNPLNIHNMRQFEHCPPHLEKVLFDSKVSDKVIINWIYENLEGRFYIGDELIADTGEPLKMFKCAAFEIKQEASFFCVMLDTFNKFDLSYI